jgi:hypothetical protein
MGKHLIRLKEKKIIQNGIPLWIIQGRGKGKKRKRKG